MGYPWSLLAPLVALRPLIEGGRSVAYQTFE
jgi:hypothetical protein